MPSGLDLSSTSLYCGDGQESNAFVLSAILSPFTSDGEAQISRSPIVCLFCGGYLNKFCRITDDNSGRWVCSLCRSCNPPLCPPSLQDTVSMYPELSSEHIDFLETEDTTISSLNETTGGFIYLFAIAMNVCRDSSFCDLLCKMLSNLPEGSAVAILILGEKSAQLLRLISSTGGGGEISSDAIPVEDAAVSYLHLFCRSGAHVIPAVKAEENFSNIFAAIRTISRMRLSNGIKREISVGSR